ncbi:MAG: hypothetical protein CMP98_12000 [Gammaproteobacteria bacterium]|nr:hypothetical protein [Gammaproteobacteria bacterium]OUU07753.1 MAG: hypothetical protein CBB94_12360 [Gammaproteobacteria bacterium TMED34]
MPMLLELTDVHKTYGDFQAVTEMSFAIPSGSGYRLLGPTGVRTRQLQGSRSFPPGFCSETDVFQLLKVAFHSCERHRGQKVRF